MRLNSFQDKEGQIVILDTVIARETLLANVQKLNKKRARDAKVELCCKKIVGDEVTRLSQVESRYVEEEEVGRFFEEPYIGL